MIGFKLKERRVPRHDYRILNEEGGLIGRVTSGTMSPSLEYPIGMGYVETKYAMPGTVIQIEINNKLFAAEIVKIPFVQL